MNQHNIESVYYTICDAKRNQVIGKNNLWFLLIIIMKTSKI